jgi:lipopolysaccharide biosynthesis glycosyltransferase
VLPNLKRVIYLDVDLLVLEDLRELWEQPITPHVLGARALVHPGYGPVWNVVRKMEARSPGISEALLRGAAGLWDLTAEGFNAGVLVMDLEALRRGSFCDDTLSLAVRFHLHDNEALVVRANGGFARLPPRWNYMPTIEHESRPALIHWVGPLKPWLPGGRVRHQELWESYRRHAARAARRSG